MLREIVLDPINTSADLTSAALSYTTTTDRPFQLVGVYFHASVDITETISVVKDMLAGANYDTELLSANLSAANDYVFRPTGREVFSKGDEVKVTCTKANTTGTIYVSIFIIELPGG